MEDNLKIPDGEYNLTIRRQVQNRHLAGTQEYFQYVAKLSLLGIFPSVLNETVDVTELVQKFHGRGIYDPNPRDGSPREKVNTGEIVGKYWDYDENALVDTTWIEIVYSKKGTHIYPIRPQL